MDLRCNETVANDDIDDDSGMDGIKSFADPALQTDQRVLSNVLRRVWSQPQLPDYFSTGVQSSIKPHMRKIVVGWMLDVTEEQICHPEVFALAVNYLDRFLSMVAIQKGQFQLLAAVCIFLASKFKETNPLCAEKLVVYSDFSITTQDITQWELMVLQVLNWELSAVTPYCVADQLLRRLNLESFDKNQARHYTETLVSLAAADYNLQIQYGPCLLGVSSLATSLARMRVHPDQDNGLRQLLHSLCSLTGLNMQDIIECVNQLEHMIAENSPNALQPPPAKVAKQNSPPVFSHNSHSTNATTSNGFSSNSNFCSNLNTVSSTPTDMVDISTTCVY